MKKRRALPRPPRRPAPRTQSRRHRAEPGAKAGIRAGSGAGAGPPRAPRRAPRAIDARNAWLMYSLMRDVIRRGTGRKARVLERGDLAGKTGTTNDQYDAWFSGFSPDLVATAWIGFDEFRPLGRRETGASAALPMWIAYMREALEGTQERSVPPPRGHLDGADRSGHRGSGRCIARRGGVRELSKGAGAVETRGTRIRGGIGSHGGGREAVLTAASRGGRARPPRWRCRRRSGAGSTTCPRDRDGRRRCAPACACRCLSGAPPSSGWWSASPRRARWMRRGSSGYAPSSTPSRCSIRRC